jgi:hypothetical protein
VSVEKVVWRGHSCPRLMLFPLCSSVSSVVKKILTTEDTEGHRGNLGGSDAEAQNGSTGRQSSTRS